MKFTYNDGGRAAAGYKGKTGDCVARSIAIATGIPYSDVYKSMATINATSRSRCRAAGKKSARNGVDVKSAGFKRYMASIGWYWTPLCRIGQQKKYHLNAFDLPIYNGPLIVAVSRHYTAVIDGIIHDTYDPSRSGERMVYGYWQQEAR